MKRNKGYVLVYSLIAMSLCCALVISAVSITLYYGNNTNRKIGSEGALYVADSGIDAFENYLNAYYKDKGNIKTNVPELWTAVYDIVNEIVPIVGETEDTKSLLALKGYLNFNYIISKENKTRSLSADIALNGAYKVYISELKKPDIRDTGQITLLSIGEYTYQNKSYYKFITAKVLIVPIEKDGFITEFALKTVEYYETIKGGNELWGNVAW